MLVTPDNHVGCIPTQFSSFFYNPQNKVFPSLTCCSVRDLIFEFFRQINWWVSLVCPKSRYVYVSQFWIEEASGRQIHYVQMAMGEICRSDVSFEHIDVCKYSTEQISATKLRSGHVCSNQSRALQIRLIQRNVLKVSINHRRVRKIQSVKRGTSQIGLIKERFPPHISFKIFCSRNSYPQETGDIEGLLQIGWKRWILGNIPRNPVLRLFSHKVKKKIKHHSVRVCRVTFRQLSQSINSCESHCQFLALQHLRAFLEPVYDQSFFCKISLAIGSHCLFVSYRDLAVKDCGLLYRGLTLTVGRHCPPYGERHADDPNGDETKISYHGRPVSTSAPECQRPNFRAHTNHRQSTEANQSEIDRKEKCGFVFEKIDTLGVSATNLRRLDFGFRRTFRAGGFTHQGGVQKASKNNFIKPERARVCNRRVTT